MLETTLRLVASALVLAVGAGLTFTGMRMPRFRFLTGIGIWIGAVGVATVAVNYRPETVLALDTWVAVPVATATVGIIILLTAKLPRRTRSAN